MKKIRMAMLAVALLGGVAVVAEAQGGGGRGQGRGGRGGVTALLAGTSVATDSVFIAKAQEIAAKYAVETGPIQQAMMAARQGGAAVDSAQIKKMAEINAKRNAEIRALLTKEEDKKLFDENAARPQGRRGGGGR
jgi:hypothetical protein